MTASPTWQFWVDRGGTFTDCLGISPEGEVRTTKVLSSDRAPLEAIAKLAAGGGFQNHDWCVVRRSILGRHTLSLCWRR